MKKFLPLSALAAGALATVVVKPIGNLRDSDRVVTDVSGLVSAVTNLAGIVTNIPATLSTTYRKIGDDQAYAVKSVGGVASWECSRPDLAEALKGVQPELGYDYGDGYVEYYLNLSVGDDYWYGWAYAHKDATEFWFTLYRDYYNEEYDYWDTEYAEAKAIRGVSEYDIDHPIGRFALKSEVDDSVGAIRDGVNNLTGLLTSETKLWRTGKPNECGHGWGYMQHNLTNDLRRWRIRAPKVTFPAIYSPNVEPGNKRDWVPPDTTSFRIMGCVLYDQYNRNVNGEKYLGFRMDDRAFTYGLLDWRYEFVASQTRGVTGGDGVTEVDYRLSLPWVSFDLRCVSGQNYETEVHAVNEHVATEEIGDEIKITLPVSYSVTNIAFFPVSPNTRYGYTTNQTYKSSQGFGYYAYCTNQVKRLQVTHITVPKRGLVKSGSISVPVTLWGQVELEYLIHLRSVVEKSGVVHPDPIDEWYTGVTEFTVKAASLLDISVASSTQLGDIYSDAYRLMGTYDANLFYDSALGCTFRIVSSNGVFFTEIHHDGDWRQKAWR